MLSEEGAAYIHKMKLLDLAWKDTVIAVEKYHHLLSEMYRTGGIMDSVELPYDTRPRDIN